MVWRAHIVGSDDFIRPQMTFPTPQGGRLFSWVHPPPLVAKGLGYAYKNENSLMSINHQAVLAEILPQLFPQRRAIGVGSHLFLSPEQTVANPNTLYPSNLSPGTHP